MMKREEIEKLIKRDGKGVVVRIIAAQGSTPRDVGTAMIVLADGRFTGTIGGGTLEWLAQAEAQKLLKSGADRKVLDVTLGPDLGQCCGGRTRIQLDVVRHDMLGVLDEHMIDPQSASICIFGAGHVGRALVLALAPLPFSIRWVDPRPNAFPAVVPANVRCVWASNAARELDAAQDGTIIVVLTHSHALDLDIVASALLSARFPYVGLIGSETKRARFTSQLAKLGISPSGIESLVCPIGDKRIANKDPAVIAAGIVPQLLMQKQKLEELIAVKKTARAG
jgi:xanthine dehydrogenase accessory factor